MDGARERFAGLFRPVDSAWLVAFRVGFGALMLWDVTRYGFMGRVREYFIEPDFHFKYFGFEWVEPWPGIGLYVHFAVLGILAVMITVGLFYRVATTLFFLGFTYTYLLDQAKYLNHFYLVCLIAFLMIFLPAHRDVSLDARRRPRWRRSTVPRWTLLLLRFQIGLVYFYAGVAKLNGDWLTGEPLRTWLGKRSYFPALDAVLHSEFVVYGMSYGGMLFDLAVAPLLLFARTRPYAFGVALFFHLTNFLLFNIGVFPWFMIVATLVFFPADSARRWEWIPARREDEGEDEVAAGVEETTETAPTPGRSLIVLALVLWASFQVLVPLRHWLYPGNVAWTEEGHRFSWRMKLRTKEGWSRFIVTEGVQGERWVINPADYLTSRQNGKMSRTPDMILQFAHFLAEEYRRQGYREVEVRARVEVSLNARPMHTLIDPEVDLAARPRNLWPSDWILPLPEDD